MNNFKFISIGFDEECSFLLDEGLLNDFEFKDYIVEGGLCNFVSKEEGINEINNFINKSNDWFNTEGIEELNKFNKELVRFKELMKEGLMVSWCVEYDNSWMIIFGDNDEIINWYNREIEFDD